MIKVKMVCQPILLFIAITFLFSISKTIGSTIFFQKQIGTIQLLLFFLSISMYHKINQNNLKKASRVVTCK